MVNYTANLARSFAKIVNSCDAWIFDAPVKAIAGIIWALSIPIRMIQSGLVRSYKLSMVLGLIGILGYYLYVSSHTVR